MAAVRDTACMTRLAFNPPGQGLPVWIGTFALNLLALAMPLAMLQIFDRIIPFQASGTLLVFFIGLVIVTLMEFALRRARIVLLGHSGSAFEIALADRVLVHTLNTVPRAYERDTAGTHFDRFGAIAQLREHHAGQGRLLAIDLPFTLIFIGLIALIGGWLVLVPLALLAVIAVTGLITRTVQGGLLDRRKSVDSRRFSFLIEFLSQIATVKSCRMEGQMLRRYEMLHKQSIDASRRIIALAGASQTAGAVLGQLAVAAMGLCGAFFVIKGAIGIGDLAACMLLNGRTTQPLLKLLGMISQQEGTRQARGKIGEIAAMPRRAAPPEVPRTLTGAISFHDVALRHPTSGVTLFENLSTDVAPGERIVLRSGDGGGRSSLMRMILAEQAPARGGVFIDGAPAHSYARARGPGGVVILEQDPAIFRGTILENITLFGAAGPRDRALALSEAIGLDVDIRALPLGYQTAVGTGGGRYSRGFLQRICIARALCMKPKILLFNNAASALDAAAAGQVARAIDRHAAHATILMVSAQQALVGLARREIRLDIAHGQGASVAAWDADLAAERRETIALESKIA